MEPVPMDLKNIFHYGKECFTNRRWILFKVAALLWLVPGLIGTAALSRSGHYFSLLMKESGPSNGENIVVWAVTALNSAFSPVLGVLILDLVLFVFGFLILARSCLDYFSSEHSSFASIASESFVKMLTKAPFAVIALIFLSVPAMIFPLTRIILACLMPLIAFEMMTQGPSRNGFLIAFRGIFLRFAESKNRWLLFSHVLTLSGLLFSLMFLGQMGISQLHTLYGFEAYTPPGENAVFMMSKPYLVGTVLAEVWQWICLAIYVPFLAAIYSAFSARSSLSSNALHSEAIDG